MKKFCKVHLIITALAMGIASNSFGVVFSEGEHWEAFEYKGIELYHNYGWPFSSTADGQTQNGDWMGIGHEDPLTGWFTYGPARSFLGKGNLDIYADFDLSGVPTLHPSGTILATVDVISALGEINTETHIRVGDSRITMEGPARWYRQRFTSTLYSFQNIISPLGIQFRMRNVLPGTWVRLRKVMFKWTKI